VPFQKLRGDGAHTEVDDDFREHEQRDGEQQPGMDLVVVQERNPDPTVKATAGDGERNQGEPGDGGDDGDPRCHVAKGRPDQAGAKEQLI
jgi:hypothetical protein